MNIVCKTKINTDFSILAKTLAIQLKILYVISLHNTWCMISSPLEEIDYFKYLKCMECRKVGLYCPPHRDEVEKILAKYRCRIPHPYSPVAN
jgi:hypothetical protein